MRWKIYRGTKAQRRVVKQATRDIQDALGGPWCRSDTDTGTILIDDSSFVGKKESWLGVHSPPADITVSSLLTGRQLYLITIHEIGHALGLGHTAKGVMACCPLPAQARLLKRDRLKWSGEIADRVLRRSPSRRACILRKILTLHKVK